jgi:endonuclease-3
MSSPVTRTRRSPRNHHTDIVNTTEQIKKKRRVSIPSSSVAKTEKVKTEKVKTEKVKTEKAKAARVKTERDSTCIPPPNWQIVYDTLESFREITKAPVDTMGCERLADPTASPKDQRFQTLIALMLSSQTKDTVTSVAVRKLQNELEGGLTLETILAIDETRLDQFIKTVGFHAKKASYIKRAAEILRDQYAGDIPDTIEGLTSLPGVGPKMGYLTLQVAWNMNLGIGVDVHVHRICNRLGWVKTNTPEETRMVYTFIYIYIYIYIWFDEKILIS